MPVIRLEPLVEATHEVVPFDCREGFSNWKAMGLGEIASGETKKLQDGAPKIAKLPYNS